MFSYKNLIGICVFLWLCFVACKKDVLTWDEKSWDQYRYNVPNASKTFLFNDTVSDFYFERYYSKNGKDIRDTVTWIKIDTQFINGIHYSVIQRDNSPFSGSILLNPMQIGYSDKEPLYARIRSYSSVNGMVFDVSMALRMSGDTHSYIVKIGDVNLKYQYISPPLQETINGIDCRMIQSSIDSININSFNRFTIDMLFAENFGLNWFRFSRIDRINGDTLEKVLYRRIYN